MKRYIKSVFIFLILITSCNNYAYGSALDDIEEILIQAGVEEGFIDNIINYAHTNNIPEEKLTASINLTNHTVRCINGRNKLFDFSIGEIVYIYNNITTICNNLNMKININFINLKLSITDNETGAIIFSGDVRKLNQYYSMFETIISNEDFINELTKQNS